MLSRLTNSQIYFRSSDSLTPEALFKMGFKVREKPIHKEWWKDAIREAQGPCKGSGYDADSRKCVCMTTYFNSAALFPGQRGDSQPESNTTYIYAMLLPKATQIDKDKKVVNKQEPATSVIDLHSYQVVQANVFLNTHADEVNRDADYSLLPMTEFYAYEAIAIDVDPTNIICAVKIKREPQQIDMLTHGSFLSKTPFCRFAIEEITYNISYKGLSVSADLSNDSLTPDEYFSAFKYTQMFLNSKRKAVLETPSVYFGLGGKTFFSPSKKPIRKTMPPVFIPKELGEGKPDKQDNKKPRCS